MKIRIDLKIIIFFIIFGITKQLKTYCIIMFFCLIHEMGHILAALILKMKVEKIEILVFGFSSAFIERKYKKIYEEKHMKYKLRQLIISMAGPITSFMLIILLKEVYITCPIRNEAIYSNILICLFNLLPIYPLDGGRIINCILNIKFKKEISEKITQKITYYTIIILTIISSIAVYYFKNVAIFLICIFLWYTIYKDNQLNKLNSIYLKEKATKNLIFYKENSKI